MPDDIKNHAIGPKGYRNCNLRQRFIRLIKRAGVKPWPNPFNNLREGRQGAPGGAIEDERLPNKGRACGKCRG